MSIVVNQVSKQFGNFLALDEVSLEIPDGKLVALLGPSGSGKSTLLRVIAGLEMPDRGSVWIHGQDVTHNHPQYRNIGFVFQHYALFKHLTVRQNIAFGMEVNRYDRKKIKDRVEELLDLVKLSGLGNRYPSQLSGGQRQRVALARALAVQPRVLLLDEPFGALDANVRKDLRTWLRQLHQKVHVTSVFVTHDQEEAMEVADEIVVMHQGKIEQVGSPTEIYDNPASPFVMRFVGPVSVLSTHSHLGRVYANGNTEPQNTSDSAYIRPHDIRIYTAPDKETIPAKVQSINNLGWEVQVELLLSDGHQLNALLSRTEFDRLNLSLHQEVYFVPQRIKSFEAEDYSSFAYSI